MLEKIKGYLSSQGFENIYIDMMPAAEKVKDAVGILEWDHTRSQPTGEASHYVQLQVRSLSYDAAKERCSRLLRLLDSGINERLILLDQETSCVVRPRRGPLLLERGAGYTTFYGEIVLWTNEK